MGPINSNPASVPCHYAPVGPWRLALIPVNVEKKRNQGAKFGPKMTAVRDPEVARL